MNERELEGKCALVTGGSRGIGRALVLALAEHGADVAFTYHSSAAEAHAVADEVERQGARAKAYRSDQGDPAAAKPLVAAVMDDFGRLDILINNAGVAVTQRLGDGDDYAALDRMWAINTMGVIASIRAAAHVMSDDGRIITIGSLSGTRASSAGAADYCGSKAAVAGYTRGAAHDLAPRRITVNIIESGMMSTDMAHNMREAAKAKISAAIPLRRFGDLSEMSALVTFLASSAAAYITGATLSIDGGLSA
ncbi:SDR family NAD(P)-dependent oxidoreductase [Trujillonella endophytica]|uniref:NAD(P)-dependent dehydrogenase, short-chain alcohol dehydrogenase family n=1 Tax=Trujillonella endophytica TaxID=673521 RepID=A0A1H8QSV7_9ACTN|nr:SDR family oxidoreductase [Trujillella endophytica]SEO57282.1 NAD(P)-dependent dehydrogenase, short-chain alcohol dehydrogenase family [Trujillella endophytica]